MPLEDALTITLCHSSVYFRNLLKKSYVVTDTAKYRVC